MIRMYTRLPIEFAAIQFDGSEESAGEVEYWTAGSSTPATRTRVWEASNDVLVVVHALYIKTLEGTMRVLPGSYVVRGVNGEHWAVAEDIFLKTYVPVPELMHIQV